MKIGTHENKAIHSILNLVIILLYINMMCQKYYYTIIQCHMENELIVRWEFWHLKRKSIRY